MGSPVQMQDGSKFCKQVSRLVRPFDTTAYLHDGIDARLLERLDRLREGIVELADLSDEEAARAEDEHLGDLDAEHALLVLLRAAARHRDEHHRRAVRDVLYEYVESELPVHPAGHRRKEDLDREEWLVPKVDSPVTADVRISATDACARTLPNACRGVSRAWFPSSRYPS